MRRAKKSKARKTRSKVDKSIKINIKNVMKQLQNEPPRDFIRFVKDPKRDLNFGSTTRAFNPPATYASNPLSAFPSLASVQNAPPISDQLKSQPAVYRPDGLQAETNPLDIAPSRLATREVASSAFPTARGFSAGASSQADFASPINMQPRPIGNLVSAFSDAFRAIPQLDDSELLVAEMMDQDVRNFERESRPRYQGTPEPFRSPSRAVSPSIAEVAETGTGPSHRRGRPSAASMAEQREITPTNPNLKSAGLFRGGQVKSRMG